MHNVRDTMIEFVGRPSIQANTAKHYRLHLDRLLLWLDGQGVECVEDITPERLDAWQEHLRDVGKTQATRYKARTVVKVWLRWVWWKKRIPTPNPVLYVEKVKQPRRLREKATVEEIKALLAVCNTTRFTHVRDRALVLFLFATGLRARELTALNVGDYDGETVTVRHGKGDRPRRVPVSPIAAKEMRLYRLRRPPVKDGDPLFVGQTGGRLSYEGLRAILMRRSQQAGIRRILPHMIRRASATAYLAQGVDLYRVKEILGHVSVNTTLRYIGLDLEDLRRDMLNGDPLKLLE